MEKTGGTVGTEKFCLGCMAEKGTAKVCPYCGYEEGTPPASFGITYLGWT